MGEEKIGLWTRFSRWITWQRAPIDQFKVVRPERETHIAVAYALLYIVGAAITSFIILSDPLPIASSTSFTTDFWYAIVYKIGFLLIVPTAWFWRQGYRIADLMPKWRLQFTSALSVLIAFVIGLSVNAALLPFVIRAAARFSMGEMLMRIGIGVLLPLFIAALPEEFVFRGFLQTRLERVSGRIPAILLTALLFVAWHLPSRFFLAHGSEGTAGNLVSVLVGTGIPVFTAGLIFGWFRDRYRSLPPLIAVHWGVDILPTVASLLRIPF